MGYSIYVVSCSVDAANNIESFLNAHFSGKKINAAIARDDNLHYHDKNIQNTVGFNYSGLMAYERYYLVALLQIAINKFGGVFYYDYSPDKIEYHGVINDTRFPIPSSGCWIETTIMDDNDKLCEAVENIIQITGHDK